MNCMNKMFCHICISFPGEEFGIVLLIEYGEIQNH